MTSIKVSNISKAYKIYPHKWSRLIEWLTPGNNSRHQKRWILNDLNFEITAGDSVGIMGVNGAGKSTLLKMIAGTTQATTGEIFTNGRVAALLELGMGFHPDFTGHQNVIMAGQLQGYTEEQLTQALPDIERFADIGDYIDQPLRVYSSGMQMRLAFAVATAYRPDILIVDEALSVGDAAFQRKCFSRIESFQAEGTTLLIVSHSVDMINRICSKGLLIDQGRLVMFDDAKKVSQSYEEIIFGNPIDTHIDSVESTIDTSSSKQLLDTSLINESMETQYGNQLAVIKNFSIKDYNQHPANVLTPKKPFTVVYEVYFNEACKNVSFGMMIKTVEDVCVYGENTSQKGIKRNFQKGDAVEITFKLENHLATGYYYMNCGCFSIVNGEEECLHRRVDVAMFKVSVPENKTFQIGLTDLKSETNITLK